MEKQPPDRDPSASVGGLEGFDEDTPTKSGRPGRARPLAVLIVDEHLNAATMVRLLLEANGHRCAVAVSVHGALSEVLRHRPDTVVIELGVPAFDGATLADAIRRSTGKPIRLIATTCDARIDHERAASAGFAQVLVKPIDPADLLRAVASA